MALLFAPIPVEMGMAKEAMQMASLLVKAVPPPPTSISAYKIIPLQWHLHTQLKQVQGRTAALLHSRLLPVAVFPAK